MSPSRWPIWRRTPCAFALLAVPLLSLFATACGPLPDYDTTQQRAVVPSPRLSSGRVLEQTIVPTRAGLERVEVQFVVYGEGQGAHDGDLTLAVVDDEGRAIGSASAQSSTIAHNAWLPVAFPPEAKSAGRPYKLRITASTIQDSSVTPWRTLDDSYRPGALTLNGAPVDGDIAFRAYYDYSALDLLADVERSLPVDGPAFLVVLLAALLPGVGLYLLAGGRGTLGIMDLSERLGWWIGASLATLPIGLLLVTVVGSAAGAALGGAAILALVAWPPRRSRQQAGVQQTAEAACVTNLDRRERLLSRLVAPDVAAIAVGTGALLLRFVQARGLALPLWVDSVHHTLIVELIAASGRVPVDYGPLLPSQPFTYHFAFHTLAAVPVWLARIPAEHSVLLVGQVLGALAVFPTYLLASRLSGSRWAGLVAAALAGVATTFPSYYLSWGRYPHLTGLLVLPAAFAMVSAALDRGVLSGRAIAVSAVLAGGQVLAHPRIALLLAALLASDGLARCWTARTRPAHMLRLLLVAGSVAVATSILLSPWLVRLSSSPIAGVLGRSAESTLTSFPVGMLTGGTDRYVLAAAILGVAVGLVRRRREAFVLSTWVLLALAIANPTSIGLPVNPMLGNDALAISLWMPIAVGAGVFVARVGEESRVGRWPAAARAVLAAAGCVAAIVAAMRIVPVANPTCLLATADDVQALGWLRQNSAPGAYVLANSRVWQAQIYSGTDGGYWTVPLAGRRSTMPPLVYDQGAAADVERVRADGAFVEAAVDRHPGDLRRYALERGITHIYVGALGGPITGVEVEGQSGLRLVFDSGRARVYEVVP